MLPFDSLLTGLSAEPTSDVRLSVGIVDVVVLTPAPARARERWRILTLRRAPNTRCTGAWEVVHGRIERGETPAQAARREVLEETGLATARLYAITVNPFYLPRPNVVELAVVFAAVVDAPNPVVLSTEHDQSQWRTGAAALKALAWPREHEAVRHTLHLLRSGDAGAVEDVLRVSAD